MHYWLLFSKFNTDFHAINNVEIFFQRLLVSQATTFLFTIWHVAFQIRNGRTKSNLKKIIDHFSDTYNLLDFVAVCMFMVAFGLKASTSYVCSQVIWWFLSPNRRLIYYISILPLINDSSPCYSVTLQLNFNWGVNKLRNKYVSFNVCTKYYAA